MSADRGLLKRAIVGLLDAVANEHPLGHQESKAARYVLPTRSGALIEIMFERDEKSPPNLWCLEAAAGPPLISALATRRWPSAELRTEPSAELRTERGRPV
jgi:hypothetical protein